ncbi:unnamed protein product, partial [Sphagnum compactum]
TSIPSDLVSTADHTCFILQSGSLQPIAHSLTSDVSNTQFRSPSVQREYASNSTNTSTDRINDVLKDVNNKKLEGVTRDASIPLDLSVRRLSPMISLRERSFSLTSAISPEQLRMEFESLMESKENLSVSDEPVTPEQIVCAPSLPGSPPLTPSPKRRRSNSASVSPMGLASSPLLRSQISTLPSDIIALRLSENNALVSELKSRLNSITNVRNDSASHNILLNKNQPSPSPVPPIITTPIPPIPPQIFVKKGSSKCKECNIVFCKQENYIAHKKHYCSARNIEDPENTKISPPLSPNAKSPNQLSYQQLICAACGIKFTSLDNLSAHQMYYCPKRVELQAQHQAGTLAIQVKDKCQKCKNTHDSSQACPANNSNSYKCPICDVVSPNSNEARKHIETHGGIKAFRCSLCRYKGNTLRGMRTHIRMHFDKKGGECNEENYITCIVEEDLIEIPPNTTIVPCKASPGTTISPGINQNQIYHCDSCNYSSSYKGNVARHTKLLHSSQGPLISTSPLVGEGGEPLFCNGTTDDDIGQPSQ